MGFRNPFRIQVDENDVAYVSDYSPDSRVNVRGRGPAGTGRFEIVRKPANYGWPVCYRNDLGFFKWSHHEWPATTPLTPAPNTNTQGVPATRPADPARGLRRCVDPEHLAVEPRGRLLRRAGPRGGPAGHRPRHLVLVQRQRSRSAARHAVPAYTQLTPGPNAPGSLTECPRLFPEFGTGGVGPHGSREVRLRPRQPQPEEVPALLRRISDPRRVHARHDARGQARLAEPHHEDQQLPGLRRGRVDNVLLRVRHAHGHAVRCRRRVLPADLRRLVLQREPGRRHVPVGVRQGPARAEGGPEHRPHRRTDAADGELLERGLARPGSGRLDPLRVGLR